MNKYQVFNQEMEKNAVKVVPLFGKSLRAMGRHPKITLGILGAGALGAGGVSLANKLHGAYMMMAERRKKKLLTSQRDILKEILAEQKITNAPESGQDPRKILIVRKNVMM